MHFCQRRWDYKCYKCAGFRYGKGEIMGKFAVKIERVITIALILSVMLILIPGVSVQAKAKKCNHKSVTWITTSKSSCTDEGMKVKKCKNCGKILKIKKIKKSGHRLRTQIEKMPTCTKPGLTATYCLNPDCIYGYRKYYKTEKIAPLGHSYIDKTYKATCTAPKTIVTSCKNCKYKSTHKEGKALGHRWSKWKLNTNSMIKKKPKKTRICSRCGKKETVYVK